MFDSRAHFLLLHCNMSSPSRRSDRRVRLVCPRASVRGRARADRTLVMVSQAAYEAERDHLRRRLAPLGHEVLYSHHVSKFQEPAHYISLRRETGDVHFVIRGTQSLADALTDGDCAPEPLGSALPELVDVTAHRGMARAARWVVRQNLATLRELLAASPAGGPARRLTVLGHSLGAGTAAIAAVILKEHFPSLRCVAFATPPCLDLAAGTACATFMTSIVLQDDVVSRASLQNVEELRCRLQAIQWRDMAAKDFANTRAGQAAAAANVSLASLASHTSNAVKSFTGKDEYTFGDITATLVSRGAGRIASAMSSGQKTELEAGEKAGTRGKGEGGTFKAAAKSAKGAAVGGASAAAGLARKFAGLAGSAISSGMSATGDKAPAAADDSAAAITKTPAIYRRIFAKERLVLEGDDGGEEATPFFFVPGKVYHLRRGQHGAGASAAHVAADSPTLCRIELSSSLIADHSLDAYGEALDTLAIRPAPGGGVDGYKVEVCGTLEWEEAGGVKYNIGMGKWTAHEECYVLAHELCIKRPSKDGELMPVKVDLWGSDYTAVRHEYKGKGPLGIKITDPGKKHVIRLYVPGGEEALERWLAVIQRCCAGQRGAPCPPPHSATPVAVI